MAVVDLDVLAEVDEHFADTVGTFRWEAPAVTRDAAIANRCGPIAFAFAVYLRANSLPGGLVHVSGMPTGFPPGTGHYMATSGLWVVDWAYRQFDPSAALPLIYERADLQGARSWHPWTKVSGELECDDPLYPDFVDYEENRDALSYVVPGTGDPQWVTPFDER